MSDRGRRIRTQTRGLVWVAAVGLWLGMIPASWSQDSDGVAETTVSWDQQPHDAAAEAVLHVYVTGRTESGEEAALPCRVRVHNAAGQPLDGGEHGVYADGRFFVEGEFTIVTQPGQIKLQIEAGPNFTTCEESIRMVAGQRAVGRVQLAQWFSPEREGWFAGDHHVHAQHDREAAIKTSLAYTALQARANGLSFVTEAGSNVDYDQLEALSGPRFQMRVSPEIRPGPFVGHLNRLGDPSPLVEERLSRIQRQPLPVQALRDWVDPYGGLLIHTHPLTPRHQAHWMGATELVSDMVQQRTAHALDIDSRMVEQLWFAALNLGNRMAASSYTDCALGRRQTLSPGDRRVYVWLAPEDRDPVNYDAMVRSFRSGHSIATNGGPLFATMTVITQDNRHVLPGDSVLVEQLAKPSQLEVQLAHRFPVTEVELYGRGRRLAAWSHLDWKAVDRKTLELPDDVRAGDWIVLRVQDDRGHWAITSPIFVEGASPPSQPGASSALVVQISNATRFIELRRDFFLHVLATVDRGRQLAAVRLWRDGELVQEWLPSQGQHLGPAGKLPVTEIDGPYENGWVWHPHPDAPTHVQLDWQLRESGVYRVVVEDHEGRSFESAALRFDSQASNSHQISHVQVQGPMTQVQWWGYSEEMPLDEIQLPFSGDHWWYPQHSEFRMEARFGDQTREFGADAAALQTHFSP